MEPRPTDPPPPAQEPVVLDPATAEPAPGAAPVAGAAPAAVPGQQASNEKRAIAGAIDFGLVIVASFVLGLFGTLGGFLGNAVAAAYILLRDGLPIDQMRMRSFGKQTQTLRVERLDGGAMDMATSIKRNITLVLPNLFWALAALFAVFGFASRGAGGFGAGMAGAGLFALLAMLSSLLVLVELVLVFADGEGRRLGDKLAGTKVVHAAD